MSTPSRVEIYRGPPDDDPKFIKWPPGWTKLVMLRKKIYMGEKHPRKDHYWISPRGKTYCGLYQAKKALLADRDGQDTDVNTPIRVMVKKRKAAECNSNSGSVASAGSNDRDGQDTDVDTPVRAMAKKIKTAECNSNSGIGASVNEAASAKDAPVNDDDSKGKASGNGSSVTLMGQLTMSTKKLLGFLPRFLRLQKDPVVPSAAVAIEAPEVPSAAVAIEAPELPLPAEATEAPEFRSPPTRDELWENKYGLLRRFKEQNGHVIVPWSGSTRNLAKWISRQRKNYREGKLPRDRIEKLEELGVALPCREQVRRVLSSEELQFQRDDSMSDQDHRAFRFVIKSHSARYHTVGRKEKTDIINQIVAEVSTFVSFEQTEYPVIRDKVRNAFKSNWSKVMNMRRVPSTS